MLQRLPVSTTFVKFLVVGGFGYLVNQSTLFLLYDSPVAALLPAKGSALDFILFTHSDVRLLIASAVAVELSIISNFFWHERWTFRDRERSTSLPIRFLTFNSASIGSPLISFTTVNVLTPLFGINPYIANTIGICLGTAWNWTWTSMVIWPRAQDAGAGTGPAGDGRR
ncbi:MAG: GtrA family protein [Dehalococcoidia bacterium]|nr:MAG: GtrA family protein [Dehalococcoidia bacterium]